MPLANNSPNLCSDLYSSSRLCICKYSVSHLGTVGSRYYVSSSTATLCKCIRHSHNSVRQRAGPGAGSLDQEPPVLDREPAVLDREPAVLDRETAVWTGSRQYWTGSRQHWTGSRQCWTGSRQYSPLAEQFVFVAFPGCRQRRGLLVHGQVGQLAADAQRLLAVRLAHCVGGVVPQATRSA